MKKFLWILSVLTMLYGMGYAALTNPGSYYFTLGNSYTSNWNSYAGCGPFAYQILTPGALPASLTTNTIYFLQSGTYTTTQTTLGSCVGVIGMGSVTVNGNTLGGTFSVTNQQNIILENIKIQNTNDGGFYISSSQNITAKYLLTTNNANANGIEANSSSGIFFDHLISHNNGNHGIFIYGNNSNGIIQNSQFFNNTSNGLLIQTSGFIVDNNHIYNNGTNGITVGSTHNSFNNLLIYNNANDGIITNGSAQFNVFRNIYAYNNSNIGFNIQGSENILQSLVASNNGGAGYDIVGGFPNYIYDRLESFGNGATDTTGGAVPSYLDSTGTMLNVTTTGVLIVGPGPIACADTVNPNYNSINLLGSASCNNQGQQSRTPGINEVGYTYGSNVDLNRIKVKYAILIPSLALGGSAGSVVAKSIPFYADTTPSSFSYSTVYGANTGTITTGTTAGLVGSLNIPTIIFASGVGMEYATGLGGTWTTGPMVVDNSENIFVRLVSSINTGTFVTGFLTIGGFNTNFLVATIPLMAPPVGGGGGGGGGRICGNGVLQGPEQCDDGNTANGDGCSFSCQLEYVCGNGTLESGEECDDGNKINGDLCSATCKDETKQMQLTGSLSGNKVAEEIIKGSVTGTVYFQDLHQLLLSYTLSKNTCNYDDEDYQNIQFTDIEGVRYQEHIETLLNYCIIKGHNSKFLVNKESSRAELAKMLVKILYLGQKKPEINEKIKYKGLTYYKDVLKEHRFAVYVGLGKELNIFKILDKKSKDGNFLPEELVSKVEVIETIRGILLGLKKKNPVFEAAVARMESKKGNITRGELARLLQYGFGLRNDYGRIMRSKNYDFLLSIYDNMKSIPLSDQKAFIEGVISDVNSFDTDTIKKNNLYKKGLLNDLNRILKQEKPEEFFLGSGLFVFGLKSFGGSEVDKTSQEKNSPDSITDTYKQQSLPFGFKFTRPFKYNENHKDIKILQQFLQREGFYTGEINGINDKKTVTAIENFQRANKIITNKTPYKSRGYLGPTTRNTINRKL